jgi:hypothetical protein
VRALLPLVPGDPLPRGTLHHRFGPHHAGRVGTGSGTWRRPDHFCRLRRSHDPDSSEEASSRIRLSITCPSEESSSHSSRRRLAESLHTRLREVPLRLPAVFPTREAARSAAFWWSEVFYNRRRHAPSAASWRPSSSKRRWLTALPCPTVHLSTEAGQAQVPDRPLVRSTHRFQAELVRRYRDGGYTLRVDGITRRQLNKAANALGDLIVAIR